MHPYKIERERLQFHVRRTGGQRLIERLRDPCSHSLLQTEDDLAGFVVRTAVRAVADEGADDAERHEAFGCDGDPQTQKTLCVCEGVGVSV